MPYEVTTPVFEGPFDLLLHLITSEQVDVYDVSLSRIVDGFLAEVSRMETLDLEVTTEFLLIAATLLELKCHRLLPGRDEVELDEELALWEERDLLLARLLECKTYKDVAEALAALMAEASRSIPRTAGADETFANLAPDLLAGVTAEDLHTAMSKVSAPRPTPRVDMNHVAPIRLSVAEAVEELVARLPRAAPVTFRAITAHLSDRIEVIVNFLAVLEMYKLGLVDLEQGHTFGELHVLWVGDHLDEGAVPIGEISSDVPSSESPELGVAGAIGASE